MDTKEIKINVPEGYEIDKENSTFECIRFKPTQKNLPKTWEEFCLSHPKNIGECWINTCADIGIVKSKSLRCANYNRNAYPNKELAKAALALCQLLQLRDCYNDGWKPNWSSRNQSKFTIVVLDNELTISVSWAENRIMTFYSSEIRNEFFKNFRDLLEIAKPLL